MESQKSKICSVCKKEQRLNRFCTFKSKRTGKTLYLHRCKVCDRKRVRDYWTEHRERRQENKLRWHYGITLKDYTEMLLRQNGVCAICGKPETRCHNGKIAMLSVDHNHGNNKNRGLLCDLCNKMLGLSREDISVLESAIRYLKFWQNVNLNVK